jgi:hypothetical protein
MSTHTHHNNNQPHTHTPHTHQATHTHAHTQPHTHTHTHTSTYTHTVEKKKTFIEKYYGRAHCRRRRIVELGLPIDKMRSTWADAMLNNMRREFGCAYALVNDFSVTGADSFKPKSLTLCLSTDFTRWPGW